jgi:hypothetical protein
MPVSKQSQPGLSDDRLTARAGLSMDDPLKDWARREHIEKARLAVVFWLLKASASMVERVVLMVEPRISWSV